MEQANIDYYDTTKKKVIDFCIGFFGLITLDLLIIYIIKNWNITSTPSWLASFGLSLILSFITIFIAKQFSRRYVVSGVITSLFVLPVLIFGAALMFSNFLNF